MHIFAWSSEARVKLPGLVSDGMVLQRERDVCIWGNADEGEKITVSFRKQKFETITDKDREWNITLPAMEAGGPYTMTINDIEIKDILIGDVWLTSGQSNMELPVRRMLDLYADEASSYANENIRYVKVPASQNYHKPQTDIPDVSWKTLTVENALDYSGLCYFFAKDLYEKTRVPIGIINSSVGGSPIESWISEEGLKKFPQYLHDRALHCSDSYVENSRKLAREGNALWYSILNSQDKGLNGEVRWNSPDFMDIDWDEADLNDSDWSLDGKSFINGSFWFRKEVELTDRFAGRNAVLRLGCIVDADSVFVNGIFVGSTSYQYPPRIYPVPGDLLKQGKNTIAIRLISHTEQARFVEDKPYKLIFDDGEIDLRRNWKYKIGARMPARQSPPSVEQRATGYYNGMIAPLNKLSFSGAIWYQGESNTSRYHEYGELMTSLIHNWRGLFGQPDLPFLIVQLPNFTRELPYPSDGDWAYMHEKQQKITQTVPNTGLVVSIDAGEWNDIHPLNKKDLGKRLSLQAQRLVYGNKNIIADGPVLETVRRKDNKLILSFKAGTNDLFPADELRGFAVAGRDNNYHWAKAVIENNTVVVWNDQIREPVKVRYAWADNPGQVNLKNNAGLPASPFQATVEEK